MSTPAPTRAVLVVLAYLWLLAIVPLAAAKDDPDVQWHARHGLALAAAEALLAAAFWLAVGLASLVSAGTGCAFSFFFLVMWIAILIVHFVAAIKALGGSRLTIPWVSRYADRA